MILTCFDRTSFWLNHRRRIDENTLNTSRRKRRPDTTGNGLRYAVDPVSSDRTPF